MRKYSLATITELAPGDLPIANCRSPYQEGRQVKPYSTWLLRWELQASFLGTSAFSHEDLSGAGTTWLTEINEGAMSQSCRPRGVIPYSRFKILATLSTHHLRDRRMHQKPTQQTIQLSAIISGHLIDGTVTISPAPQPGVLSELAKFEARRILTQMIEEEIAAGRL